MPGSRAGFVGGLAAAVAVLLLVGLTLVVRYGGIGGPEAAAAGVVMVGGIYLSWVIIARTGHITGWLLLGIYLLGAISTVGYGYAELALGEPGSNLPGGAIAAWATQLVWVLQVAGLYVFVPVYFPDGVLESRLARGVVRAGVVGTGAAVVVSALRPEIYGFEGVQAPLAFVGAPKAVLDVVDGIALVTVLSCGLLAVGLLVARFRSSHGVRRLQLKWLFWGILLSILLDLPGTLAEDASTVLALVSELLIPLGIAVAITRYRLYAIDKLVRRTVSYALLTAGLVVLYAGLVLGAQRLLGTDEAHDLVVAGSTLAIAALFQPMRRRVQNLVDRRFNRRHEGARAEVNRFAKTVRDDVDLDTLIQDVVRAASVAVQPTTVALTIIGPVSGGPAAGDGTSSV